MRTAFASWLTSAATRDDRILLMTGDLGYSVFDDFRVRHPDKFLNVGVAEAALIGMAAGAALEGRRVYAYSIATFLVYRPLEQIRIDLCYQEVPVCLVGAGGGLTYADAGATHHASEDLGIMSMMPGMTVLAPGDPFEVEALLDHVVNLQGPSYLRLSRGKDRKVHESKPEIRVGTPLRIIDGSDASILAIGNMLPVAVDVCKELGAKGYSVAVSSVHTLKPFDSEFVRKEAARTGVLITLEEHVPLGGLLTHVSHSLSGMNFDVRVLGFTLPDAFMHVSGTQEYLRNQHGLDSASVTKSLMKTLRKGQPR